MIAADRLIVALDVPGLEEARALVARLGSAARFYKVGSQLFTAAGPEGTDYPALLRDVFGDLEGSDPSALSLENSPLLRNIVSFGDEAPG